METPVSGGSKGWAISAVVVGSVVLLFTLMSVAQVTYLAVTGKTFARDAMRGVVAMMPGKNAVGDYDALLAEQTRQMKELAPLQLGLLVPYALALVAAIVIASMLLAGRISPVWLARAALLTCLLRLGWGYGHYRVSSLATSAVKQGFQRGMARAEDINRARGLRTNDEAVERIGSVAETVGQVMIVVTVAGQALLIAGYWGIVAFVFSKSRKPAGPAAVAAT